MTNEVVFDESKLKIRDINLSVAYLAHAHVVLPDSLLLFLYKRIKSYFIFGSVF
jgi:hypothetical protein